MKTASGLSRPESAAGAVSHDDGDAMRQAERGRIGANVGRAILARFDCERFTAGQRPFDRNRARTCPNVPEDFAGPGRERRQRQRAHRPLGDLAVMNKKTVIKSGRARQACIALGFQRDRNGACDFIRAKTIRTAFIDALARPTERRQCPEPRCAPAARNEPRCEFSRGLAVAHETDDARACAQGAARAARTGPRAVPGRRRPRAASPAATPRAKTSRALDSAIHSPASK